MAGLHFWLPTPTDDREMDLWDPDGAPERYADGVGHNVVELVVRLRRRGLSITTGPRIPPGARVVVFLPTLLHRKDQLSLYRELLLAHKVEVISIRSDFLPDYRLPVRPSIEVMPNRASVVAYDQTWIPPLPQRGLISRERSRFGAVTTLAFKGYPENLPDVMRSPQWAAQLRAEGLEWDIDLRNALTGDNRWHDFSRADVVLCMRSEGFEPGWLRKPATKLINAWCAGSIPLISREPGYLELATHGEDCLIVDSVADVISALRKLRRTPDLVIHLERRIAERRQAFQPSLVLDAWQSLLCGPAPTLSTWGISLPWKILRVSGRLLLDELAGKDRSSIWSEELPTDARVPGSGPASLDISNP